MSVKNILIDIMMAMSLLAAVFTGVIFNVKLPPLLKLYEDKAEKACMIVCLVFCDILLLLGMILIINEIIWKL